MYSSPSTALGAQRGEVAAGVGLGEALAPHASPRAIGGRYRCRCSGVPCAMIDGPIQFAFMYCGPRGSPRDHSSSPSTATSHGLARLPRTPWASAASTSCARPACRRTGASTRRSPATREPRPAVPVIRQFLIEKRSSSARNATSSDAHPNSTSSPFLANQYTHLPLSGPGPSAVTNLSGSTATVGASPRSVEAGDLVRLVPELGEHLVVVVAERGGGCGSNGAARPRTAPGTRCADGSP